MASTEHTPYRADGGGSRLRLEKHFLSTARPYLEGQSSPGDRVLHYLPSWLSYGRLHRYTEEDSYIQTSSDPTWVIPDTTNPCCPHSEISLNLTSGLETHSGQVIMQYNVYILIVTFFTRQNYTNMADMVEGFHLIVKGRESATLEKQTRQQNICLFGGERSVL